jgi:outer membrane immunogenic protein
LFSDLRADQRRSGIRMKKLALTAVILTFSTLAASAADLAARPYTKAPAVAAPVYDWTGFYIGGSIGGRWDDSTWTTTTTNIPAIPATVINNPVGFSNSSVRAGVFGGYNWQVAPQWVIGIEADVAWADNKSSTSPIPGVFGILVPTQDFAERKDRWDAGIRGRIGYLLTPGLLAFATGGVSWINSEASAHCGNTAPNWCSGNNFTTRRVDTVSKTLTGWTVGGGLEWMLSQNWLLRGEYRYAEYDGYNFALLQNGSTGNGTVDAFNGSIGRLRTHTGLFGVAYKFGGPVVAKY